MIREILEKMEKEQLIDLIINYDNYIKDFDEDFQGLDRVPICVLEYLDNEGVSYNSIIDKKEVL